MGYWRMPRPAISVVVAALWLPGAACAELLTISTPGGDVQVEITHVGPDGSLVAPAPPASEFRPPSIFATPVPAGSGARALGLAGAFTAVADDATAASWNPAGLIQLERPEASLMLRGAYIRQNHKSGSNSFRAGDDRFQQISLNYFSAALPFRLADRNLVFAINYQEAFDFNQRFSATGLNSGSSAAGAGRSGTFEGVTTTNYNDGTIVMTVNAYLTTRYRSVLNEVLAQDLVSSIDFEQQGIIDAGTPALAVEILPGLSAGAALNLYQDSWLPGGSIKSTTRAEYSGLSCAASAITDQRTTEGTYDYSGRWYFYDGPVYTNLPFSGRGVVQPFSGTTVSRRRGNVFVDGVYEEYNEFKDLYGFNATFGVLWSVNRYLSLGATLDLPWTAYATQRKTIRNRVTTYTADRRQVLDYSDTQQTTSKDVEFDFPLYWAVGSVIRITDKLYTSLDLSQTRWSDYAYQADGEPRLNPLDGTPHGEHRIDDCWSARWGAEYLVVFSKTEVPLRGGLIWEQRPAIGDPDNYYGFSLGSGVSIGKDPGKLIIDVAYNFMWANNAMQSLVPSHPELSTDVREHQVFVSCIKHF